MNKLKKIILAVLGGADTLIHVITPIVLVSLWVSIVGLEGWRNFLFYGIGLLASLFRGIKVGFMN